MNFELSEELVQLRDQARRFLADRCPPAVPRRILDTAEPYAAGLWRSVAEMGWTGAAIPEQYGGGGLGRLAVCVLAEELDRAVAPIPFSSSVYLATEAILLFGSERQKQTWLPRLANGEAIGTFAMAEQPGASDPARLRASVSLGRLTGTKFAVPDGDIADFAIVAVNGCAGHWLHLVELTAAGVSREAATSFDPTRSQARIEFSSVQADPLPGSTGGETICSLLDYAAVPMAFEQVGGAQAALDMANAYAKERYAFGRPAGCFQGIQDKLADMHIQVEMARSNAHYGAWAVHTNAADLPIAASVARIAACEAGWFVTKENIQAHGGTGVTRQMDWHLSYHRAKLLGLVLGGARDQIEALGVAVYTTDAEGRVTRLPHDECPMAICLKEDRPIRGAWAYAQRPDGTRVPFAPYPTPVHDEDGKLVGAVNVLTDITGIKEAETAREGTEARFRAVQETSPEGFVFFEAVRGPDEMVEDFAVSYANPAAARLLRSAPENLEHARLRDLFLDEAPGTAGLVPLYADVLATGAPLVRELRHQIPGRRVRWLRHRAVPLDDGIAVTFEDVTYRLRAEERIRSLALHDSLTGLPNRHNFRQCLGDAILDHRRTNKGLAILSFDLDRFKNINDTFGHSAGDKLLQIVAQRLRNLVRQDDVVARLGGDEFAILLLGGGLAAAEALGKNVIEVLNRPYQLDDYRAVVGVSVGIVAVPDAGSGGIELETLLKHADLALYRAKADGRGTCCVFAESMLKEQRARVELEIDLREAIARDELRLHFQPVFDLRTNQLNGFEALARWQHPTRGMISPADFIPVAEESGLIGPVGKWVLQRACADAAGWPVALKVAVNLSAVQLAGTDLVQTVQIVLAQTALEPCRLELEITESVLLQQSEAVQTALQCLRSIGVRIALDDFGTKYSSLSYLRSFPFDKIKIDQSFVRDAVGCPDCLAIVRSVAALGNQLGMIVTAEGIEGAEHLAMIREAGCAEAQGHYLGRPNANPAVYFGARSDL